MLFFKWHHCGSQGLAERQRRLDDAVANPFVESMGAFANDIGTQIDGPTPLPTSPFLGTLHQELADPAAPMALIHDEPPDLCVQINEQQGAGMGVNPTGYVSVRQFSDVNDVAILPVNLFESSSRFFA
jgi:hypothetical protein